MLINNQWITEEIKGAIKNYLETNDNENSTIQKLWYTAKSSSEGQVYSNTILPQETRKISNKQPILTPKATRERRTNKNQSY